MNYPTTQLEELGSFLERFDGKIWINDGTLLGVIREGHLLKSDPDIDLAMWYDDQTTLSELTAHLNDIGYNSKIYKYNGKIVQKSFKPTNSPYLRPVTVKVFHRYEDLAYSPTFKALNSHEFPSPFYFIVGIPNQLQAWYHNFQQKLLRYKSMSSKFVKLNSTLKTWVIPAKYFEKRTYLEEFNLYAPNQIHDYLTYRYQNWEVPDHDWDYWTDDPALKQVHPDEFF